jgi:hypothetical protein
MKKFTILLLMLFCGVVVSYSQCDKKYKLKPERIVTITDSGSEGEEIPFSADITLSKDSIHILINLPDGTSAEVRGKHVETICKMDSTYNEGTIEYKTDAELTNQGELRKHKMNFLLEAKAGKFKLYGVPEDQPGEKVCFIIGEKQEVK